MGAEPKLREPPRYGKGPIKPSVGQCQMENELNGVPTRLEEDFNRVKNRSPYVYVPENEQPVSW